MLRPWVLRPEPGAGVSFCLKNRLILRACPPSYGATGGEEGGCTATVASVTFYLQRLQYRLDLPPASLPACPAERWRPYIATKARACVNRKRKTGCPCARAAGARSQSDSCKKAFGGYLQPATSWSHLSLRCPAVSPSFSLAGTPLPSERFAARARSVSRWLPRVIDAQYPDPVYTADRGETLGCLP